jgi:hypothetical protein
MDTPFVKLYIGNLNVITKLSPTAKNTLLGMLYYLDEDNTIDISIHRREQMLHLLDIKKQTLANGLVELQKAGVISRIGQSYYMLVPSFIEKPKDNDYKLES